MSGPVGVLLDLLFPPKCVFCGKLLTSGERDFCARCQRELYTVFPERKRRKKK